MTLESKARVLPQQGKTSPSEHLKNALEQIVLLTARPELQSTSGIFDKINHLQVEINAKEAELSKAQNDFEAWKAR